VFLAGNPPADNAKLITSGYATNAILDTRGGEGGAIQVAVSAGPGLVRIEVTDHAPLVAMRTAYPASSATSFASLVATSTIRSNAIPASDPATVTAAGESAS